MRDITGAITVNGDFNINDNGGPGRPLCELSNDGLRVEREFRIKRRSHERARRVRALFLCLAVALGLLATAGIVAWFMGDVDTASLLLGAAGFGVGFLGLRTWGGPNTFENAHSRALREIRDLLRLRGVR
jgi:hypothetical protein